MNRFAALAAVLVVASSSAASAEPLSRRPYLVLTNGLPMIVWETDVEAPTVLRYGTAPGLLLTEFNDPEPTRYHQVILTALEPSTAYYYAVGTADGALEEGPELFFLSPPRGSANASGHLRAAPQLEELSPGPGEEGVGADVAVEVRIRDEGPGIAPEGVELIVDGVHVQPAVGGTPHARYVSWKPAVPFVAGAVVRVEVRARNLDGTELAPVRASFGVALDALAYEDDVPEPEQPRAVEPVVSPDLPAGYSCSTATAAQPAGILLLAALLVLRRCAAYAQRSMLRLWRLARPARAAAQGRSSE